MELDGTATVTRTVIARNSVVASAQSGPTFAQGGGALATTLLRAITVLVTVAVPSSSMPPPSVNAPPLPVDDTLFELTAALSRTSDAPTSRKMPPAKVPASPLAFVSETLLLLIVVLRIVTDGLAKPEIAIPPAKALRPRRQRPRPSRCCC